MNKKRNVIIGINGKAGSGKDTVGTLFRESINNYYLAQVKGEATPLKYFFCEALKKFKVGWHSTIQVNDMTQLIYSFNLGDNLKQFCSYLYSIPLNMFYDSNKHDKHSYYNLRTGKLINVKSLKNYDYKIFTSKELNDYYTTNLSKLTTSYELSNQLFKLDDESMPFNMLINIRELMVYTGNYLIQRRLHKNTFFNSMCDSSQFKEALDLDKVIVINDIRFDSEYHALVDRFKDDRDIYLFNVVRPDSEYNVSNASEEGISKQLIDEKFIKIENTTLDNIYNNIEEMLDVIKINHILK